MDVMFDTLAYARRMEGVGFTRAQAEAMAEEQAKLIDERLATKADLGLLRNDLTREIADGRNDLTREIASVRTDLTREIASVRTDLTREVASVRTDLTREIATLRSDLTRDMELLRRDILIKIGGMMVAALAAMSTIVALITRLR